MVLPEKRGAHSESFYRDMSIETVYIFFSLHKDSLLLSAFRLLGEIVYPCPFLRQEGFLLAIPDHLKMIESAEMLYEDGAFCEKTVQSILLKLPPFPINYTYFTLNSQTYLFRQNILLGRESHSRRDFSEPSG